MAKNQGRVRAVDYVETDPLLVIPRETQDDRHSSLTDTGEKLSIENAGSGKQCQARETRHNRNNRLKTWTN